MRRGALAAAVGLLAAWAVPAVSGASTAATTRLHITPGTVRPGTTVVVRFIQPLRGALLPGQRARETLSLTGAFTGGGCVGTTTVSLPVGDPGTTAREPLHPGRMAGGRWCVGVHDVALLVTESPTCPPPVRRVHVCPEFASVTTTVATARFRVTRG